MDPNTPLEMSKGIREPEPEEHPPTRQTLLNRLKNWDDQEGWQEFFDTYWRLIYRMACKAGLSDAEAQEVVQETVISVAKAMPDFRYDPANGSFKHWLRQLTGWRITDQLRRRRPELQSRPISYDDSSRTSTVERIADPGEAALEALWEREWANNLVDAAMERVKRKVDPKHYQMYDLLILQNWPASKVARAFGVSTGRIYLIKHRLSKILKKELEYLKSKQM